MTSSHSRCVRWFFARPRRDPALGHFRLDQQAAGAVVHEHLKRNGAAACSSWRQRFAGRPRRGRLAGSTSSNRDVEQRHRADQLAEAVPQRAAGFPSFAQFPVEDQPTLVHSALNALTSSIPGRQTISQERPRCGQELKRVGRATAAERCRQDQDLCAHQSGMSTAVPWSAHARRKPWTCPLLPPTLLPDGGAVLLPGARSRLRAGGGGVPGRAAHVALRRGRRRHRRHRRDRRGTQRGGRHLIGLALSSRSSLRWTRLRSAPRPARTSDGAGSSPPLTL